MSEFLNKIVNGDSLEILKKIPNKTFVLVFADPPYNLQIGKNSKDQMIVKLMVLMTNGINLRVLKNTIIFVKFG